MVSDRCLYRALLLLCALPVLGCPMTYRGYRHLEGRVVAADTGVGLSNARVVVCLVDRSPAKRPPDCASTPWTKELLTDSEGRFELHETRHFTVALPFPGGTPTYDTDLLVQKEGYIQKELTWWRDREILSQQPLIIRLEPERSRADTVP
jgi:hypothetical protein